MKKSDIYNNDYIRTCGFLSLYVIVCLVQEEEFAGLKLCYYDNWISIGYFIWWWLFDATYQKERGE